MENVEINVNLKECSFSIKGTEEYVDKKTKDIIDLFEKFNVKEIVNKEKYIKEKSNVLDSDTETENNNENKKYKKYVDAGLISVDIDDVIILRKVPGKNNAEKMKNIALITLYALDKPISSKSIVSNCQKLSCYDQKNFSAVFKNDKNGNFIRKGNGKVWTLEATIPGLEKAQEILEEMFNAAKK